MNKLCAFILTCCKQVVHVQLESLQHPVYSNDPRTCYFTTTPLNLITTHSLSFFSPHSYNLDIQLFSASIDGRDQEVLDLLHRGAHPDTHLALHWACFTNHPRCAELLIKWGASLSHTDDVYGQSPLYYACEGNSMDCVRLLMSHNSPTGEPGCVCSCVQSLAAMLGDCQLV